MESSQYRPSEQGGILVSDFTGEITGGEGRVAQAAVTCSPGPLLQRPVAALPLLNAHRAALEGGSVVCVCRNVQEAQQFYLHTIYSRGGWEVRPFIYHELMPLHQRSYSADAMDAARGLADESGMVIFTTVAGWHQLSQELAWLSNEDVELQSTTGIFAPPADDEPVVKCICLRETPSGHWVLTDHDRAATVSADTAPTDEVTRRLMRHTVELSGARLAPYLATVFDVPQAWKADPQLALCSLLVFRQGECDLGVRAAGLPETIAWDDRVGLILS